MPEDATWPVATPQQMVMAWDQGVTSHPNHEYVRRELVAHPIPKGLADPTFHRSDYRHNAGWHSASGILNPGAMRGMRDYLEANHLRPPEATEAAWQRTLEQLAKKAQVQRVVGDAMEEAWESAETVEEWCEAIIKALENHMEQIQ